MLDAEYVLPVKSAKSLAHTDLTPYLEQLSSWMDVTVVDGSAEDVFQKHSQCWAGMVRHCRPISWPGRNGKVAGVITGVQTARHEYVVIADDDVRYTRAALMSVIQLLRVGDIVRPQNYFDALSWHTHWDTARTLLNRAIGSDFPGTLALRRKVLLDAGGYRGDVLFENLELMRTVRAAGGHEVRADELFVARKPPTVRHFLSQRVRQAYDDFALPARAAVELSLAPIFVWSARQPRLLMVDALAICLCAAFGRRRAHGRDVFSVVSIFWAPVWVAERAVCIWIALGARILGGAKYGGHRLKTSATPLRVLRREIAMRIRRNASQ